MARIRVNVVWSDSPLGSWTLPVTVSETLLVTAVVDCECCVGAGNAASNGEGCCTGAGAGEDCAGFLVVLWFGGNVGGGAFWIATPPADGVGGAATIPGGIGTRGSLLVLLVVVLAAALILN